MGIHSINLAYGASYGAYNQKLTQQTKEKLEALGISYAQNISEKDAQKLIKSFEAQKQQETNQSGIFQNPSSSNSLLDRARKLAEKLGIQIPQEATLQQILILIQAKIEEKLAASSNDINALKELKNFSQELAFIQAQSNGSSGYDNTNQALMTSLEMLSEYNKNFLNR